MLGSKSLEFVLAMPPITILALASAGVFMAIVSFVFIMASANSSENSVICRAHVIVKMPRLIIALSGVAVLVAAGLAIWAIIPWYVAVPMVGLSLLYAPPLESAFHRLPGGSATGGAVILVSNAVLSLALFNSLG